MIVSVVNIKGGVGKTTTAIALATAASRRGIKVVVLDTDPQGSSSDWALYAEEDGDALPFDVNSANIANVRRLRDDPTRLVVIDCPPSGNVTDAAVERSTFVVVPTSPMPVDLAKTWDTIESLSDGGTPYGVLLTRVDPRTITFKSAVAELADGKAKVFGTTIPKRETVASTFGRAFGDDLFGYAEVLGEILEACDGE